MKEPNANCEAVVSEQPYGVNAGRVGLWLAERSMFIFVVSVAAVFAVSLTAYLRWRLAAVEAINTPIMICVIFRAAIEVLWSLYAGYFIFISVYFLATAGERKNRKPPVKDGAAPSLCIVYLCCDDLDVGCLASLCRTRTRGALRVIVHDDSSGQDQQRRVDGAVEDLCRRHDVDIVVLRRGNRLGGKPGALNYVLERIPESFEWMLVCDNDSMAADADWYLRVAEDLKDSSLAAVQFRNVGCAEEATNTFQRQLHSSIDVFEVFVAPAQRFGWLPFFGHNAILRTSAVRQVGGFQPGEFADDIDMSVRLNLAGYSIKYRQDIAFRESHPENYRAFRARSYKWAYGCASVLRRWTIPILKSPIMKLHQKFFFFIFIGFYYTQILLLAYLLVTYFIMPVFVPHYDFSPLVTVIGGSAVIVLVYLPTLAYFLASGMLSKWPRFAGTVGLVYGSTDFVSARAVVDCFLGRKRTWTPTNTVKARLNNPVSSWFESAMGFGMLAVPFVMLPQLLFWPCSYLFAMKFMLIPVLYAGYRNAGSAGGAGRTVGACLADVSGDSDHA